MKLLCLGLLLAASAPAADNRIPVTVFDFEVGPGVAPEVGRHVAGIVSSDLALFPPLAPVAAPAGRTTPPPPTFSAGDASPAEVGRRLGVAAYINGKIVVSGPVASIVIKVTDTATGAVSGDLQRADDSTPMADLAAELSQKAAKLILAGRNLAAPSWPNASLAGANARFVVDGLPRKTAPATLLPGCHDVIASVEQAGRSTRGAFFVKARPGAQLRLAVETGADGRNTLRLLDAAADVAAPVRAQWVPGPDTPLLPVANHRIPADMMGVPAVADDQAIYLARGSEAPALNRLYRFDLRTHQTSVLAEGLFRRSQPQMALWAGKIYLLGGHVGKFAQNVLQIFDLQTHRLTDGPPMPDARAAFGCAAIAGRIYVVGGAITVPNSTDRVSVYDIATSAWSAGPPLPHSAIGNCVAVGDRLIMAGGARGEGRNYVDQQVNYVQEFDPRTNRWTELTPLRFRWFSLKPVYFDGRIFLIGSPFDDVHGLAYDLTSGRTDYFPLTDSDVNGTAVAAQGHIFVVGGLQPGFRSGAARIQEFEENPNWRLNPTAFAGGPPRP